MPPPFFAEKGGWGRPEVPRQAEKAPDPPVSKVCHLLGVQRLGRSPEQKTPEVMGRGVEAGLNGVG